MKQIFYHSIYAFFRYKRKKAMLEMGGVPLSLIFGSSRLFYWRFGPGTDKNPVIFLHGLLDEGFGFRRIIKQLLNSDHDFFVFDLPGYGESRLPDFPYLFQIDVWAELLLGALSDLKINSCSIVGHSMGGLIAQHMALKDQKKIIKKLILIAPANAPHSQRDEMRSILFPKTTSEMDRLMGYLYFKETPTPPVWIKKVLIFIWNSKPNQYLEKNTLQREGEIFLGKASKSILIPTLIIAAKNDEITTLVSLKELKKILKNSNLAIIEDAKHAVHLEKPEEIAVLLKEFLEI